jgi:hypothetical protein
MATKNTTKSLTEGQVTDKELQAQIKKAADVFKSEKLVNVSVPKTFEKYTGPTLPIGINGVFIVLPVDGSEHPVPESFAKHLKEYLNNYK